MQFARVRAADGEKRGVIEQLLEQHHLHGSALEIFLRIFKHEMALEVWGRDRGDDRFRLIKTYPICAGSGVLGPKRREGDLQVPEGFYEIDRFNPVSNYYLALGINYPNASDRILSGRQKPGGDIFIHGRCATIGCIPLQDDKIKEVYLLAVEAKSAGQHAIPVHMFPCRMDSACMDRLKATGDENTVRFWNQLKRGYDAFELRRIPPQPHIQRNGDYVF